MRHSILALILMALLLGITGCVAQKEAPSAVTPPSEQELSSEIEEVIGVTKEAAVTTETTSEIDAPDFEVSEPVDLGSVI